MLSLLYAAQHWRFAAARRRVSNATLPVVFVVGPIIARDVKADDWSRYAPSHAAPSRLRQAAATASALMPYLARSGTVGPTTAKASGMPTNRMRVGCSTARSSATAPPRPPVR